MPVCTRCGLSAHAQSNCIPCSTGSLGILFVGEAPGRDEDARGENFVGETGQLFNRCLQRVGITRRDVSVCNAVRCHPPGNRDPSGVEVDACLPYLVDDIIRLKPRVVVPMGAVALKAVLQKPSILAVRGDVLTSEKFPGVLFVPTVHPAYLLRRFEDTPIFCHDLEKALRVYNGLYTPASGTYTVCRSAKEVADVLRKLTDTVIDFVAVDTETTGLCYYRDKIVCLSFSNRRGTGYVVPLWGKDMRPIWSEVEFQEIVLSLKAFVESAVPKSFQNGAFDVLMLRGDLRINVQGWVFDSMICHHAVDENLPHGLEFLAGWYTDVPSSYKKMPEMHKPGGAANVEEEKLWKYSAIDADVTYQVSQSLVLAATADKVLSVHDRILLPLSKVLMEAQYSGIQVDTVALERIHQEHTVYRDEVLQRAYELAGGEFNTRSSKQLGHVLFEKLKLPVLKRTKPSKTHPEGQPSADAEVISALKDQHPICKLLLEVSTINHDVSNYLKGQDGKTGMLKFMDSAGRVHPSWMVHRAKTGRLSSSEPNIQAIKRGRSEGEPDFRPLFRVSPGDWVWISGDYHQAEVRVMGFVARDEYLMSILQAGTDVHTLVASQIYNVPVEDVTYEQRDRAKGVVFGLNYGRGPYTLAKEFDITVEEAQTYIDSYIALFPGVKRHFERVYQTIDKSEVIVSPFGRKRRFSGAQDLKQLTQSSRTSDDRRKSYRMALSEMHRQGINVTVQSPASDILDLATIRIAERFRGLGMSTRLLISHHDAWHGEALESEFEDSVAIIKEELERPVPELDGIVLPVEFKFGRFWSDSSIKLRGISVVEE